MKTLQSCLDSMVLKGYKTTVERSDSDDECPVVLWDAFAQQDNKEHSRKELSLSWDRVGRRILYTIPWQGEAPGASGGTIPVVKTLKKKERLLVSRVSALSALSASDREGQHGSADFQGRVVFIGGSFRDSRDIHASPLGAMPGVLVLMNALHSLL
jgi:hypothetical protein